MARYILYDYGVSQDADIDPEPGCDFIAKGDDPDALINHARLLAISACEEEGARYLGVEGHSVQYVNPDDVIVTYALLDTEQVPTI